MNIPVNKTTFRTERNEYEFSDEEFGKISQIARDKFGLYLPASKKHLVYSRLARRLRVLKVTSFREYNEILEKTPAETLTLMSALTTNVTQFFRERHHFDTLEKIVLPNLISRAIEGDKVRLWSAGCSTGQEPYSIAMSILETFPEANRYDIKVLATDIDPVVIRTAKAATYQEEDFSSVLPNLVKKYSQKQSDRRSRKLNSRVRELVRFRELNLIERLPFSSSLDVIFCRNVAIYFDQATQLGLWERFDKVLGVNGFLFLGHSERLAGPTHKKMSSIGVTTYQKRTI